LGPRIRLTRPDPLSRRLGRSAMGILDFCMARTRSPTTGFSIIGRVNSGEVTGTMSLRNRNASHLFDLYCLESLGPCNRANIDRTADPAAPRLDPQLSGVCDGGCIQTRTGSALAPKLSNPGSGGVNCHAMADWRNFILFRRLRCTNRSLRRNHVGHNTV
jgi:hypothetical protein